MSAASSQIYTTLCWFTLEIACLIVTVDRDGDVHSGDTGPEWNYRAGNEPPSLHALRKN